MIAIQTSARNGKVVGAVLANATDEIMLITTGGVLVRTRVSEIREMGRATQGVTLISVDDGSELSGVRRVVESDVDDDVDADQAAAADSTAADLAAGDAAKPDASAGSTDEAGSES
jgi:DNA gyrase subunit A